VSNVALHVNEGGREFRENELARTNTRNVFGPDVAAGIAFRVMNFATTQATTANSRHGSVAT